MIKVIPPLLKALLVGLAGLVLVLALGSWLAGVRARRLASQREQLLSQVGLLQEALLPSIPEQVGGLAVSAAYRPAEGIAAGGDFYDIFQCPDGRVGLIVGDLSGHGREALSRTSLVRHTVRAYLEAGLEPRSAAKLAGRVLGPSFAEEEFATVLIAVFHPEDGMLTFAAAGHPPPVLRGPFAHEPISAGSAPPLGRGFRTGQRQTHVAFPQGSLALFYSDGLFEARVGDRVVGYERLARAFATLGDQPTAGSVVDRVVEIADRTPDDMVACVIRATADAASFGGRVEELEASLGDFERAYPRRFLEACGFSEDELSELLRLGGRAAKQHFSALLRVDLSGGAPSVEVLPGNLVDIGARLGAPEGPGRAGSQSA